jgi:hypothetical protein
MAYLIIGQEGSEHGINLYLRLQQKLTDKRNEGVRKSCSEILESMSVIPINRALLW